MPRKTTYTPEMKAFIAENIKGRRYLWFSVTPLGVSAGYRPALIRSNARAAFAF